MQQSFGMRQTTFCWGCWIELPSFGFLEAPAGMSVAATEYRIPIPMLQAEAETELLVYLPVPRTQGGGFRGSGRLFDDQLGFASW